MTENHPWRWVDQPAAPAASTMPALDHKPTVDRAILEAKRQRDIILEEKYQNWRRAFPQRVEVAIARAFNLDAKIQYETNGDFALRSAASEILGAVKALRTATKDDAPAALEKLEELVFSHKLMHAILAQQRKPKGGTQPAPIPTTFATRSNRK